jgi:hypothetical protein
VPQDAGLQEAGAGALRNLAFGNGEQQAREKSGARVGLGWVGLGWVGLGWVGLGWVGLGRVG